MAEVMYEALGSLEYDGLVVSAFPPADAFHVTIRKLSEAATYTRGTLLDLSTGSAGDMRMVIHGTAAEASETLTANCILAKDYEVGTAADVTALAYRTGHFAENKLTVKEGASITAADKEALRSVGVLLSDAFPVT